MGKTGRTATAISCATDWHARLSALTASFAPAARRSSDRSVHSGKRAAHKSRRIREAAHKLPVDRNAFAFPFCSSQNHPQTGDLIGPCKAAISLSDMMTTCKRVKRRFAVRSDHSVDCFRPFAFLRKALCESFFPPADSSFFCA